MPFDLSAFEAELSLRLIPADQLPVAAQHALDAGHTGPHLQHLALADPRTLALLDDDLPSILTELGGRTLSPAVAALRLARQRAQAILATHEDPLPALPYFRQLVLLGDQPAELHDLACLGDNFAVSPEDQAHLRTFTTELLFDLVSPKSRDQRRHDRRAEQDAATLQDWPFVFESPTGLALLRSRFLTRLKLTRATFAMALIGWLLFGAAYPLWRIALIGCIATLLAMTLFALWSQYKLLERERRETLLRLTDSDSQAEAAPSSEATNQRLAS